MPRPLLVLCLLTLLRRPPHVAVNAWPAAGLDVVANAADCALVRPIFEARNASATRATIPRGTPIDGKWQVGGRASSLETRRATNSSVYVYETSKRFIRIRLRVNIAAHGHEAVQRPRPRPRPSFSSFATQSSNVAAICEIFFAFFALGKP